MRLFKLIWKFNKHLYPADNPLPGSYLIVPFFVLCAFFAAIFFYQITYVAERVEFLSFSPLSSPAGKLNSLAYFSALEGDLDLGRYFYRLSLEYVPNPIAVDDQLIGLIYPNEELERKNLRVEELLEVFPTSRDLNILKANNAIQLGDDDSLNESLDKLQLIDPNNEFVLGITDMSVNTLNQAK